MTPWKSDLLIPISIRQWTCEPSYNRISCSPACAALVRPLGTATATITVLLYFCYSSIRERFVDDPVLLVYPWQSCESPNITGVSLAVLSMIQCYWCIPGSLMNEPVLKVYPWQSCGWSSVTGVSLTVFEWPSVTGVSLAFLWMSQCYYCIHGSQAYDPVLLVYPWQSCGWSSVTSVSMADLWMTQCYWCIHSKLVDDPVLLVYPWQSC